MKQQDKLLKSLVEAAEKFNLKPTQAVEISSIKQNL